MATGAEPIFQCARDVLWVILEQPSPTLKDLAKVLDRLAVAYAETPTGAFTENAPVRPRSDLRKVIGPRFSQLGFYADIDPMDLEFAKSVGDGIDDLVDIAEQMLELQWILDQSLPNDALYDLHLLAWHWMGHVRGLSRYLHFLQYGSPSHNVDAAN